MLNTIRQATGLAVIMALVLISAACPKSQKDKSVAFARDLVASLQSAIPIVRQKSPALADRLTKAANSADQLIAAINASNQTEIVALVRDIMPTFTAVAQQFSGDQNVLIALALGQIALNFFVDHYVNATMIPRAARAQNSDAQALREFKALPKFGCQYRPERCSQ